MPLTLAEIENEARHLSLEERARLIGRLIETLDPGDGGNVDAAWEAEVVRRSAEIAEGKVRPVPAEEALARIRRTMQ